MSTIKESIGIEPPPIAIIVKDLLSHAEQFARLCRDAVDMEESGWATIRSWHEPTPSEIDQGFVNPKKTRDMANEVAQVYGMKDLSETLLAWLYVKHRQRLLTHRHIIFRGENGFQVAAPCSTTESDTFEAYSYGGCTGPTGDIVDFHGLDLALIHFQSHVPKESYWQLLRSDWGMPLGMLDYGMALSPIDNAIKIFIKNHPEKVSALNVLENLAYWARKIEADPHSQLNYIALVTHARILQALAVK